MTVTGPTAVPPGISPQCALERHTSEMGACRTCTCGRHAGKVPIPTDVIHVACHLEHQGAFCRARAHIHCAGTGTCAVDGASVPCSCACHGAVVGAMA